MLKRIISFFFRRGHQTRTTHSVKQILTKKYDLLGKKLDSAFTQREYLSSKTVGVERKSIDIARTQ